MTFDLAQTQRKLEADCLVLATEMLDAAKAEIIRLTARVERLEGALGFYRDAWGYKTNKRYGGLEWHPMPSLLDDCGNIASAALSTPTEEPKT